MSAPETIQRLKAATGRGIDQLACHRTCALYGLTEEGMGVEEGTG